MPHIPTLVNIMLPSAGQRRPRKFASKFNPMPVTSEDELLSTRCGSINLC